jgi:predicted aspartyl protease
MMPRAARSAFLLLTATLLSGQAAPRAEPAPSPETVIDTLGDRADRMTVPVSIGGKGPFRFVVDTGAERTVIARELANQLDLGAGRRTRVHSMTEVSTIDTVIIPQLQVGGRDVLQIHAPALARRNLGAEGMLGVDSLQSQRVSFDFDRNQMTVSPATRREERWAADAIVITGRSRFGHLVLVDAAIDGQKVWVIIDTGSQVTIGNEALRRKLLDKKRLGAPSPLELISVTGGSIVAQQSIARRIRLGDITITGLPVAFADVHPFRKLDLVDRPALLLGMDALRVFGRVSVDFANRKVRLLSRPQSGLRSETQLARAGAGGAGS